MGRHTSRQTHNTDDFICNEISKQLKNIQKEQREQYIRDKECNHHMNIQEGDEKLIPIFDPDKNYYTIEKWISNVDKVPKQFGWNDLNIMRIISKRLQGRAKIWMNTRSSIATSWTEQKTILINLFNKPLPFAKLLKEAVMYEAKPAQDLADYCLQKLDKWHKINIPVADKYVIDYVIDGIKNTTLSTNIRACRHTELTSFCQYMQSMGRVPTENVYSRQTFIKCSNKYFKQLQLCTSKPKSSLLLQLRKKTTFCQTMS